MTPEALLKAAEEGGGYETPRLNDELYLHFKGFSKIENLEPYTGLKALWLESNGVQKLENLEALRQLRCLYIQQNLIERIEGLDTLVHLRVLDISSNRLQKLENLSCLPELQTVKADKNFLANAESISELTRCPRVQTINLCNNNLDGADEVLTTLAAIPILGAMEVAGNPIMNTPGFRKKCINAIPRLGYMDRPIFEGERFVAEAWGKGGREAEVAAREEWRAMEKEKQRVDRQAWKDWVAARQEERKKELAERGPRELTPEEAAAEEAKQAEAQRTFDAETRSVAGNGVMKQAYKFWAKDPSDIPPPKANFQGQMEAASFRAPSFVPEDDDDEEPDYMWQAYVGTEEGGKGAKDKGERGKTQARQGQGAGQASEEKDHDEVPDLEDGEETKAEEIEATLEKTEEATTVADDTQALPTPPTTPAPAAVQIMPPPLPTPQEQMQVQEPAVADVVSDITPPTPALEAGEQERQERVSASLALYRQQRKAALQQEKLERGNKRGVPATRSTFPTDDDDEPAAPEAQQEGGRSAGQEAAQSEVAGTEPLSWTEAMDLKLSALVRRTGSFDDCAAAITGTLTASTLTAEDCRRRWDELSFGNAPPDMTASSSQARADPVDNLSSLVADPAKEAPEDDEAVLAGSATSFKLDLPSVSDAASEETDFDALD